MHTLMYVLIIYKDEKNKMKNKGDRVVTTLYSYISDALVQLTRVWQIIKLIQAVMVVLVTCKDEEDQLKNKRCYSGHKRSPIVSLCRFL